MEPVKHLSPVVKKFFIDLQIPLPPLYQHANKFFIVNEEMNKELQKDCQFAGIYAGILKGNEFVPSAMLLEKSQAPRVSLDTKGAWLFLCGRDVFTSAILEAPVKQIGYVLVCDKHNIILGYGRWKHERDVSIRTIFDLGYLLRRELTRKVARAHVRSA